MEIGKCYKHNLLFFLRRPAVKTLPAQHQCFRFSLLQPLWLSGSFLNASGWLLSQGPDTCSSLTELFFLSRLASYHLELRSESFPKRPSSMSSFENPLLYHLPRTEMIYFPTCLLPVPSVSPAPRPVSTAGLVLTKHYRKHK